jgi:glucose/mannose-6-phosphate isomerase
MVVPVLTVKDYELPACVGPKWLALAVSYSGETEEVITATQHALERGVPVVAVTSGGTLEAIAAGAGASVISPVVDVPVPRAAVGALAVPCLVVVDRLGLVPEDAFDFEAAAAQAGRRLRQCGLEDDSQSDASNPARRLASGIGSRVPVFYGGGPLGAVAAYRAKCDVNENAKRPAFAHSHPELGHNEVCGWSAGPWTEGSCVINLWVGLEHPQVARRMEAVASLVGNALEVRAEGEGALARLFDIITIAQWASLHLAFAEGVDPGPIDAIEQLKTRI